MRRTMIVLMVALLLAAAVFGGAQAASQNYSRWTSASLDSCSANVRFLSTWEYQAVDAGTTFQWSIGLNGTYYPVGEYPVSGSDSGTAYYGDYLGAVSYPYTYEAIWVTVVNGTPVYESHVTITCTSAVEGTISLTNTDRTGSSASGPGRDMVTLPADAVVGTFVTNVELLWMPDGSAGTEIVMTTGKSLWVVGMDETGMYYKVLLSGQPFWVPAASIGPTFNDVWNGTPLPTTVVN